ncbi:hypothetical protein CJ030_MR8G007905 [Morella rubra]|uniref:F-box domain-containing protein n=1 Tax=Morella rubra TaxID=262757 RepID=A0A6A1UP44_9ROSI|nr:hypothetical protein CJ030_MR8G007905 [Morella rubra]
MSSQHSSSNRVESPAPRYSKTKPMLKVNELAEDLAVQILLCLPVISLLRFKCVCKGWYALITHQNFVYKHLFHNKNKKPLFLVHRRDRATEDYLVSRLSYETLQVSLTQPMPPPYFGIDKKVDIYISGSCNGLVCLCDNYNLNTVLWNPATKETKVVPRSYVPRFPAGHIVSTIGLGFGFDVETNDYKIIKLLKFRDPDPYTIEKAAIDWEGVLSFDMSKEVFLITPLPDEEVYGHESDNWKNFFVLNELVAMAIYIREEGPFELDIWLLLEYGVKESWTKLVTVGPNLTGFIQTLGYGKNDTIFLTNLMGSWSCMTLLPKK